MTKVTSRKKLDRNPRYRRRTNSARCHLCTRRLSMSFVYYQHKDSRRRWQSLRSQGGRSGKEPKKPRDSTARNKAGQRAKQSTLEPRS
eukprot:17635_4